MTDLVPLAERMEYSKALSASDLLPKQFRNAPANVLVALEYGNALGLSPMAAIQGIHVVEGRPTASAQLIGALVRNAGHRLRVQGDDRHAVAVIVRRDDPDFEFRAEWTMERAKAANLAGKGVWKQYPAAMLKARAITEVARDACPEVLSGVAYTAEELGADEPVKRVDTSRIAPKPTLVRVETVAETVESEPVDTETGEILDAEVVESALEIDAVDPLDEDDQLEPITDAQMRKMQALLRALNVTDRDERRTMIGDILARPLESAKDLTKEEASMVIDTLDEMARHNADG